VSFNTLPLGRADFEDRIALLEEHLPPSPTAEDWLKRAEEDLAKARELRRHPSRSAQACASLREASARSSLMFAKARRKLEEEAWADDDEPC
jgi:hypothetical protein